MRLLRDPLPWLVVALIAATLGMPALRPLFAAMFPWLDRPVYAQDSFTSLVLAHLQLVGISSAVSVLLGRGDGSFLPATHLGVDSGP